MTYCCTGHRPPKLGGYSESALDKLTSFALTTLRNHKLITTLVTGMAQGWDTAMALAALELEIPVIAALPCIDQERLWPKESQDLYHLILSQVDERQIVSQTGYDGHPWVMQKRNMWIVDHSKGVLALWDGLHSGTAACIKYANRKMVPVENYWDQWKVY